MNGTRRSDPRYGKGRHKMAWMTLKIAVFAPTPSARVNTAIPVNPRDFSKVRAA
jgi:hypothetical protein